jgi:uncharacterized repeat protein (TIGR04076 family)
MATRARLKITVLRKMNAQEVYGKPLPEVTDSFPAYCNRLEVGQEFIADESGEMPAGFCHWAWHDIYPVIMHLQFGGDFWWITKPGLLYACCTDGVRPVFFKIERS